MKRSAELSECGKYRYSLSREWDDTLPQLTWVMLNPSTADAEKDDATIRRCIGFAKRWGYGSIRVLNLFSWRATDPKELEREDIEPLGEAPKYLQGIEGDVIAAWGGSVPKGWGRWDTYLTALMAQMHMKHEISRWWSLGLTKGGQPRHPVRLPYSTEREPWPPNNYQRPVSL